MKSIRLPESSNPSQSNNVVETESSIVVIGANGSGKTRLGTWIEFQAGFDTREKVHRISAQKSLTMPQSVSPVSMKKAEVMLYYGYDVDKQKIANQTPSKFKVGSRWGQNPETFLLNDFEQLLVYLFSDNYEQVIAYKHQSENTAEKVIPPITKIDTVKKIWETLLPHRKLQIKANTVLAKVKDSLDNSYNASQMSDGERVIFYLIGECLCAYENGIIIIDEPELHLHKSIQGKLWDLVEQERPDCLFIYLTHDLDFAATRNEATKICLKSYSDHFYNWYEIPAKSELPEDVYLEILGSRNPILFVEGEKGSLDVEVFQLIYPQFTIKPLGSCEKVLAATKAFNSLNSLHYINAYGIIDRDYKSEEHLQGYNQHNVYAPNVAEVENLFMLEEVLLAVAKQYCVSKPEELVSTIKLWAFEEFARLKTKFAVEKTSYRVNLFLNGFNGKVENINELTNKVNNLANQINTEDYYNQTLEHANKLIENQNYNELIKIFNHKGLTSQVGKHFEIKPSAYVKKVKDIIRSGNEEIIKAMEQELPKIN